MEVDQKPSIVQSPREVIDKVVVHPLVLLSVVDHFNRMSKVGNQKRVVGVLLGSVRNKVLDVANSFAGTVPVRALVLNVASALYLSKIIKSLSCVLSFVFLLSLNLSSAVMLQ